GARSVLEFPIGKTLFETTRPAWIGQVRVSPRGDLLAFVRYPGGELQGEVVVVDLEGKTRQVSRQWRRVGELAWSPRNEVWFGGGGQIQVLPLGGRERTIYAGLTAVSVHDIAADGSVLLGQGVLERDISFLEEGAPNARSLA